jgi:hypothetical protein
MDSILLHPDVSELILSQIPQERIVALSRTCTVMYHIFNQSYWRRRLRIKWEKELPELQISWSKIFFLCTYTNTLFSDGIKYSDRGMILLGLEMDSKRIPNNKHKLLKQVCAKGWIDVVASILPRVSLEPQRKTECVVIAVSRGNCELLSYLLETFEGYLDTANVLDACESVECVKVLLLDRRFPLQSMMRLMKRSCKDDNRPMIKYLLEAGLVPDMECLNIAVHRRHSDVVECILDCDAFELEGKITITKYDWCLEELLLNHPKVGPDMITTQTSTFYGGR